MNFEELARCTDDFNGAQLKAVCVEAVSTNILSIYKIVHVFFYWFHWQACFSFNNAFYMYIEMKNECKILSTIRYWKQFKNFASPQIILAKKNPNKTLCDTRFAKNYTRTLSKYGHKKQQTE